MKFWDTASCRHRIHFLKRLYTCSYSFENGTVSKMANILQSFGWISGMFLVLNRSSNSTILSLRKILFCMSISSSTILVLLSLLQKRQLHIVPFSANIFLSDMCFLSKRSNLCPLEKNNCRLNLKAELEGKAKDSWNHCRICSKN